MACRAKQTLAVWKFASCDGCQLSLLDCEDELLALAERVEIAYFLEATSATVEGPYDVSIVEGSITTAHDAERIQEVRRQSRALITIGACATAGGIQALRNFADVEDFTRDRLRLARLHLDARHLDADQRARAGRLRAATAARSTSSQLLEVIGAHLAGRRPRVRAHSVCVECKRRGTVCVMVAHGTPCLGPVTHAGCGAICPAYDRGCYGCYGPMETPNTAALSARMAAARLRRARPGPRLPHLQRRRAGRSGRPARRMSDARRTRMIRTDYLARVEGEGAMYVRLDGGEVARGQAAHLRAAALLRGVPARPRVHRGARHHRADLRHLPGRLPDERRAGDGGRLRRGDRRGPAARPAPPALLRRVDREPQPARLHAARAGLPRLRGRRSRWPAITASIVEQGLQMKKAGNAVMARGRRPGGPPDQRPRRRLLPGAHPRASCARSSDPLERARETALATVALGRDAAVPGRASCAPELRRAVRARRATRSTSARSSPTAAWTSPRRSSTSTSSRSTSSTPTRCTPASASAAPT